MKGALLSGAAALSLLCACGNPHPPTAASLSAPASQPAEAAGSAPPAATRISASTDGVSIAWHQYGRGEPAVILIHGWALDSSIWRAQLTALAAHCTVVTLDLGGRGSSGERTSGSMPYFAHDVATVAAALPNSRILLVGQGMGGPVALEAAPLIGPRLAGIIGVETFRTLGRPPLLASQLDHALQPFRTDFPGAVRRYVSDTLFRPHSDPTLVHAIAELMAHADPQHALASLSELNRFDYASILPAVKVPVLAIISDFGPPVDQVRAHRVAPQLRVISLAGDDGFAMLDDARRFNTTLLQAIDSLTGR